MNYQRIYNQIIDRARTRLLEDYTERHHIIPRCMNGSNDKNNLVDLTPEEHYIAHQLLVKMYPNNMALVTAAVMMIPSRPTNKLYGWLKRKHSIAMSEFQSGNRNSQYGTRWIHNIELRKSAKIAKNEQLPNDWKEGRIVDFGRYFERMEYISNQKLKRQVLLQERQRLQTRKTAKQIKTKHFMFRKTEGYRRAKSNRLYAEFKETGLSLRKFANHKNMIPMTLSKWFREFIPEYNVVARKAANKQF